MQEEIVFYYAVYTNSNSIGFHKFWGCFLVSVLTLRHYYPNNKIVVITYENDKPPDLILEASKKIKFDLVEQEPVYAKCNQPNMNWKMFSRHINCYNHAKLEKSKAIYIDVDVFLLNQFSNFHWDKVGILNADNLAVNGGIIYFDSTKNSIKKYAEFIDQEYNDIMNGKHNKINYIKNVYPHCNEKCSIQEETMLRNLRRRDKDKFMEMFYNITIRNNGTGGLSFLGQDNLSARFNNLHLMTAPPQAIPENVYHSKHFNHILLNNYFMSKIIPGVKHCDVNLPIKMM